MANTNENRTGRRVFSEDSAAGRLHLDYLDGIRAVCALFVAAYHVFLAVYVTTKPAGAAELLSLPILYGHFSVPVFIVISGFCLALPIARGDGTLRGGYLFFLKKRARRILPPYYCAMALFILGHLASDHQIAPVNDIVAHLFLVHNFSQEIIRSKEINPSFWSIAVEWQIYFFFPLIVFCGRRFGYAKTVLWIFALAYGLYIALFKTPLQGMTTDFYFLFTLGMAASFASYSPEERWHNLRSRYPAKLISGIFLTVFIVLSRIWGPGTSEMVSTGVLNLLTGLFAVSLLIGLAKRGARGAERIALPAKFSDQFAERVYRFVSAKHLVFLGAFSYSFYLLHQPLINIVLRAAHFLRTNDDGSFFFVLVVGIPVIATVSYGFYLIAERPFLTAKRVH